MDAFWGSWKLTSSDNFAGYLEEVGLVKEQREIGSIVKPVLTILKEGDNVVIKMKTSIKSSKITFKLGQEFDETTMDDRKCRSVLYLEGGKLVHVKKWNDQECKIIREVKNGQLFMTYTCNDVVAVCTYEKE